MLRCQWQAGEANLAKNLLEGMIRAERLQVTREVGAACPANINLYEEESILCDCWDASISQGAERKLFIVLHNS